MKKLFAVMLMTFLLTPLSAISTEKDLSLSNEEKYNLSSNIATTEVYFDNIPTNPILYKDSYTYSDINLNNGLKLIKSDTKLSVINMRINDNSIPVFELADGSFIEASHQNIYDDVVYNQSSENLDFWLEDSFLTYSAPYTNGIKEVKNNLSSYTMVHATQKATTYHGTYYKINNYWINDTFLSTSDNRMEKVQSLLSQKYNKSDYSIYVKQLDSKESAGINAVMAMYAASVAKLATLYYVEEQMQNGTISANDKLTYTDKVNSFEKAYDVSGSGNMVKTADNKDYTIAELLSAVAQNSDNVATNILGYYVAHQYDADFQSEVTSIAGANWDMKSRSISAKTAANLMEAIYYQNGDIVSYLSSTDFDTSRISKDIPVQVAHKIGDAYDYKHDVAIIYADEPFILSIFTNNADYDDITNIANDVYAILK